MSTKRKDSEIEKSSTKSRKSRHAEWWQQGPIYHIYPKSFCDSNSDGIGDLRGIENRVDYLRQLDVKGIWISPIFTSPMVDHGYDISNYTDIDPIFGTIEDFKNLVLKCTSNNIKIILDFVPNHTSDQHQWFLKSCQRIDPYTDFYVWQKGDKEGKKPPSNWMSVFGGSAWHYNEIRQEYYLHQFYKEQPDLNLRNPMVVLELLKVLRFWLDLGVAGFRIDAVPHFFEDEKFLDEEVVPDKLPNTYESVTRKYTYNLQPDINELLKKFRDVLNEYAAKDGMARLMMTEAYVSDDELMEYYGDIDDVSQIGSISQMPVNFGLVSKFDATASKVKDLLMAYLSKCREHNAWPNFSLGNHDSPRGTTRFGPKIANDVMTTLVLLLPGTPITYYGEEIGMLDNKGDMAVMSDKREPCRSPMQWNRSKNAGFTQGESTWLPINESYKTINVEDQSKDETSTLQTYKTIVQIRRAHEDLILWGTTSLFIEGSSVLILKRSLGHEVILVCLNFSSSEECISKEDYLSDYEEITILWPARQRRHELMNDLKVNGESSMVLLCKFCIST